MTLIKFLKSIWTENSHKTLKTFVISEFFYTQKSSLLTSLKDIKKNLIFHFKFTNTDIRGKAQNAKIHETIKHNFPSAHMPFSPFPSPLPSSCRLSSTYDHALFFTQN